MALFTTYLGSSVERASKYFALRSVNDRRDVAILEQDASRRIMHPCLCYEHQCTTPGAVYKTIQDMGFELLYLDAYRRSPEGKKAETGQFIAEQRNAEVKLEHYDQQDLKVVTLRDTLRELQAEIVAKERHAAKIARNLEKAHRSLCKKKYKLPAGLVLLETLTQK